LPPIWQICIVPSSSAPVVLFSLKLTRAGSVPIPRRSNEVVCVVEGPDDLLAIEKTGAHQGLYHILHGVLAPMDGIGPEEIKINELVDRIRSKKITEVLIATSSTVPGEATASYLARILHPEKVKVTRLACGIPMGMDIKYADEVTLARAIETRQESK